MLDIHSSCWHVSEKQKVCAFLESQVINPTI